MVKRRLKLLLTILFGGAAVMASPAIAEGYVARSKPWQVWLQEPMSPSAEMIYEFNNQLLWLEIAIVVFVLAIMIYTIIRFSEKNNPIPSKTTHNSFLEVAWTVVPILILVAVAVPSLRILYFADRTPDAEMTLKVIGNQWYWTYAYPDYDDLEFDSIPIPDNELKEGQPRLLAVDNPVVLPAETNVRLLMTSNDVIHDWAVPALAIKIDNTPGRVNETWVRINKPGDYYGMCSELCGVNHGMMPIHVKALPKAEFLSWLDKAKKEFSNNVSDEALVQVAHASKR